VSVDWSMFVAAHRAQAPRRYARANHERALVFAPDPTVRLWIEHELFAERVKIQIVETFVDVVSTLTLVPPPWPQILIVDVDAVSRSDIPLLATIRAAGWSGVAIAIGDPSLAMRRALGIDRVLGRSFASETLRNTIKELAASTRTRLR